MLTVGIEQQKLDVLHIGGGGGVPFMLTSTQHKYPELSQASIVNATDNGGHTGYLRRLHHGGLVFGDYKVGISAAGDAIKALGALATVEGYSLESLKRRNEDGSTDGNLLFLQYYKEAVNNGETDPNQSALDSLANDMGSAPVYFATEPAQLVMSKGGHIIQAGETEIALHLEHNNPAPEEVLMRDFEVMAHCWPAQILSRPLSAIKNAGNIIVSPSHPISSTTAVIAPLKQLEQRTKDDISAKTTLVIGTENPWNMPYFTIADYLTLIERVSGLTPANVAIGQSTVETGNLPSTIQDFFEIRHEDNLPRNKEDSNPLEPHKPKTIYPAEFAGKLLEKLIRHG